MRFTQKLEQQVLDAIRESPAGCFSFPPDVYRDDGSILVYRDGVAQTIHRYLYEKVEGKIPAGHFLVQTCATEGCVNPTEHHRTLTKSAHPPRGRYPRAKRGGPDAPAINAAKMKCPHGHKYTADNLYIWTDTKGRKHRKCRKCQINRTRARHKAERDRRDNQTTITPESKGPTE